MKIESTSFRYVGFVVASCFEDGKIGIASCCTNRDILLNHNKGEKNGLESIFLVTEDKNIMYELGFPKVQVYNFSNYFVTL